MDSIRAAADRTAGAGRTVRDFYSCKAVTIQFNDILIPDRLLKGRSEQAFGTSCLTVQLNSEGFRLGKPTRLETAKPLLLWNATYHENLERAVVARDNIGKQRAWYTQFALVAGTGAAICGSGGLAAVYFGWTTATATAAGATGACVGTVVGAGVTYKQVSDRRAGNQRMRKLIEILEVLNDLLARNDGTLQEKINILLYQYKESRKIGPAAEAIVIEFVNFVAQSEDARLAEIEPAFNRARDHATIWSGVARNG